MHLENGHTKGISVRSAWNKRNKSLLCINPNDNAVNQFLDSHDSTHTYHRKTEFVGLYLLWQGSRKYTPKVSVQELQNKWLTKIDVEES